MTVASSFTINAGRALIAAMQPLTGARASGSIRIYAKLGMESRIERNSYWTPVISGRRQGSWLFKATVGPNADGSWTVTDAGTEVGFVSNIGGHKHNVDAGTVFVPTVPDENLILSGPNAPAAVDDFTGATEPGAYCGVKGMVLYETFDGPAYSLDIHRSQLTHFPGVIVAFQDLEPADGVATAQTNQSAVNAGDGTKFFKLSFSITVITSKSESDLGRRQEGQIIADSIVALLNDKHMGDPGESLSNPGGIQVRRMFREDGPQDIYKKFYLYTVLVSAMVAVRRLDFRYFPPWLRAVMNVDKPQSPAVPEQGPYRLVNNNVIDMTPGTLDMALDGTFTRVGTAYLWRPSTVADGAGELSSFLTNERRKLDSSSGVYLEPEFTNALAAVTSEFDSWTPTSAAVTPDAEDGPLGATDADTVAFAAGAGARVTSPAITLPSGQPTVVQVFAKAIGTKSKTKLRLAVTDAAAVEHVSEDIEVANVWTKLRLEVEPTMAGVGTMAVLNASDNVARSVVLWGSNYAVEAYDGPQYHPSALGTELLVFNTPGTLAVSENLNTPQSLLTGSWRLRWRAPMETHPDSLGTATGAPGRVLLSVGDGVTELVTLRMVGTPGSDGATITLTTRSGGLVLTVTDVTWEPGAELWFSVDSVAGKFELKGSDSADGEYTFDYYSDDATAADFLSIGRLTTGGEAPTPGWYIAVDTEPGFGSAAGEPPEPLEFFACQLAYFGSLGG